MKKTIKGVEYDTENAEEITHQDAVDDSVSMYLYRTQEGRYFLRTEKLQIRKGSKWVDVPMDGSSRGVSRDGFRSDEVITPMTEHEAIDWYVATVMPEPLAKAVQQKNKVDTGKGNITVTIDALSTKLVRWYADENARDITDVINGVLAGELGHMREEEESEGQDDTHLHIAEYVMDAIYRRRIVEARRGGFQHGVHDPSQTEKAIEHLQAEVAKCSGTKVDTECGAATLSIAHDRVILTNEENTVIAEEINSNIGSVARQLTGRKSELLVA